MSDALAMEPAQRPDLPYPGSSHVTAARIAELEVHIDLLTCHNNALLIQMASIASQLTPQVPRVIAAHQGDLGAERITKANYDPFTGRTTVDPVAAPADGPKADYHGPRDTSDPAYPAHKAVHDVTEHLLGGRVTDAKARQGLRKALDKADAPATGRQASDGALGRALRVATPPGNGTISVAAPAVSVAKPALPARALRGGDGVPRRL